MSAKTRIVIGAVGACAAAGLMREFADIRIADRAFDFGTWFDHALAQGWWAAPLGALWVSLSEWLRARSVWFFFLGGFVLAIAAAMAFNGPEIMSLADAARAAPMAPLLLTGLGSGLFYWMCGGYKAGWRDDGEEAEVARTRLGLRDAFATAPQKRCWPCLLGGLALATLPFLALGYWSINEPDTAAGFIRQTEFEANTALGRDGYSWASLKIDDEVGRIVGRAPSEDARRAAFEAAERIAAPAMGVPGIFAMLRNEIAVVAPLPPAAKAPAGPSPAALAADADAKRKADAKRRADEEARRVAAEAEAKQKADEDVRRVAAAAEADAKRKAEEDARRIAAEAEAKRKAEADTKRRADEEARRVAAEAEAKRKADEDARRLAAAAEIKRRADAEEARRLAAAAAATTAARSATPAPSSACDSAALAGVAQARVRFETTLAALDQPSAASLDQIHAVLSRCHDARIEIGGHTDAWGASPFNTALSQRRATVVRDALVKRGIAASRLAIKGWGADKPVAPNTTVEGRASNRRVEFALLGAVTVPTPSTSPVPASPAAPAPTASQATRSVPAPIQPPVNQPSVKTPSTVAPGAPAAEQAIACSAAIARGLEGGIRFRNASARVADAALPRLKALAAELRYCAGSGLLVEGHTDNIGSAESNLRLSTLRANEVRRLLVAYGVPSSRIRAQGFGATRPLANGSDAAALERNRRIEIATGEPPAAARKP